MVGFSKSHGQLFIVMVTTVWSILGVDLRLDHRVSNLDEPAVKGADSVLLKGVTLFEHLFVQGSKT